MSLGLLTSDGVFVMSDVITVSECAVSSCEVARFKLLVDKVAHVGYWNLYDVYEILTRWNEGRPIGITEGGVIVSEGYHGNRKEGLLMPTQLADKLNCNSLVQPFVPDNDASTMTVGGHSYTEYAYNCIQRDKLKRVKRVLVNEAYKNCKAVIACLLYTSPSPRDRQKSRMPSSA